MKMKFSVPILLIATALSAITFLTTFVSATPNPTNQHCSIPPSNVSIPVYFEEMNYCLKFLSVFEPYSDSRPANATFERSAKRLMKLGNSIDKATQRLEGFKGILSEKSVEEIDNSLQLSAKYVVNITALVEYGKPLSDKYNYTSMNVQIIQGITNQYFLLFRQLVFHIPPANYESIGFSVSTIICALTETMEYLEPGSAFTEKGREFCTELKTKGKKCDYSNISTIQKVPKCFQECNNSATAMYKYGMQTNNLRNGQNSTLPWCLSQNGSKDPCEYHPSCAFTF